MLPFTGNSTTSRRAGQPLPYNLEAEAAPNTKPAAAPNGDAPAQPESAPGPLLPIIVTSNRPLRDISRAALAALVAANDPPTVFRRGGALVRVRRDERGQPLIEPLSEAALRGRLARAATFVRLRSGGSPYHVAPPLDVVRDLAALGAWHGIPPLEGITEVPTLRPDGSILSAPGYDPQTHLYHAPAPGLVVPPIPECPTSKDIARARALLDEAFTDFCFSDTASRAAAYAALFTSVLRPSILGRTPLFAIDSPVMGSGKSALVTLCATVATGGHAGVMPEPENEGEWRKSYTARLHEGHRLIWLDEIHGRLSSPVLAQAVTVELWSDRLLSTNRVPTYENRTTIFACGNNLVIGRDLGRRTIWCRLDTRLAQPWLRDQFAHPALREWGLANRASLLWAVFTSVRAWYCAGCPDPSIPPLAGFEEWRAMVGGALACLGIHGLLGNAAAMREILDEDAAQFEQFLRAWYRVYGSAPMRAAQVAADAVAAGELRDSLPGSLIEFADERGQRKLAHKLGTLLRRRVDRRYGADGIRVERAREDGHAKVGTWCVVAAAPPDAPISGEAPGSPAGGPFVPGQTPLIADDRPDAVPRLVADDDGRRQYVLDLARSCGFPALPFAPGRAVSEGEAAWVSFTTRAPADDIDLALAALEAHADAPAEEGR